MSVPPEFPCEVCGGRFAHVVCPIVLPDHDCAQVERDNLDLHQALTTAIRQLKCRRRELRGDLALQDTVGDLERVLDRTSRPALNTIRVDAQAAPVLRRWAT